MISPPKIDGAPGLTWRKRRTGWEARWQCRTDLGERGFTPRSQRLWFGLEMTELERANVIDMCNQLQTEMLVWGRGGVPQVGAFDGKVSSLIDCYQTDADSNFLKLRYSTRQYYAALCKRINQDLGHLEIADLKARVILHWNEAIVQDGKIPMSHALVGMLRTLSSFGMTILEDEQCARLSLMLSKMRFTMGKARNERLTAEQALLIRQKAHEVGEHSIALAQAFQFELMLRQKDVIGEWLPMSEKVLSAVTFGDSKWARGITWDEIDQHLTLRHVTSKRQKEITVDLLRAPMVLEELDGRFPGWNRDRAKLPASGPVIIREEFDVPWSDDEFRRHWRRLATAAGIPTTVRNMDTRAGAISEATDAGADLEYVRQAATHSDIGMTQKYSRGAVEKVAKVMDIRVAHRNKTRS